MNWRAGLRQAARYKAAFALAAAWLAMVLLVPTATVSTPRPSALGVPAAPGGAGGPLPSEAGAGLATATSGPVAGGGTAPAAPGALSGSAPRSAGSAGAAASTPGRAPTTGGHPATPSSGGPGRPAGTAAAAAGAQGTSDLASKSSLTRAGTECRPGVRQFDSAYAPPCQPAWTAPNGGATDRGVTADVINVVSRRYGDGPDNLLAKQILSQAGQAPEESTAAVRRVFVDYFNKTYELYGRRVVLTDYTTNASVFDEINGKGRETACADAAAIAERKTFAVLPQAGMLMFGTFSDCAVAQHLFLPVGPYGYPESWYRQAHPYAFAIQMDCERIVHQLAEYTAKRLAGRSARWARDTKLTATPRVFGVMAPDFGAYRSCADLFVKDLGRAGIRLASRYNYTIDPSTSSQQAAQAVVQFKAAGVTSLLLLTDPLTAINLTSQARSQDWGPEWVISGAGLEDSEDFSRLYDQDRVNGHLFGLSELGPREADFGPQGEPARLYQALTGKALPPGTDGDYFVLVHLFNLLQQAGPGLTPDAIANGVSHLPATGGPRFDFGQWNFQTGSDGSPGADHTAVDDAREVYWNGNGTSYDGKKGVYVAAYGGKRFTNGQWTAEDPAYYPASPARAGALLWLGPAVALMRPRRRPRRGR